MPYIDKKRRKELSDSLPAPLTAGELNYTICMLAMKYLDQTKKSYQHYNDVIGVLECAKLEMYRRLVAPYEEKKIAENGDVF
jgi:hypothetical protein